MGKNVVPHKASRVGIAIALVLAAMVALNVAAQPENNLVAWIVLGILVAVAWAEYRRLRFWRAHPQFRALTEEMRRTMKALPDDGLYRNADAQVTFEVDRLGGRGRPRTHVLTRTDEAADTEAENELLVGGTGVRFRNMYYCSRWTPICRIVQSDQLCRGHRGQPVVVPPAQEPTLRSVTKMMRPLNRSGFLFPREDELRTVLAELRGARRVDLAESEPDDD